MQKTFTRRLNTLLLFFGGLLGALGANAQYTASQLDAGKFYTGVACDKDGHVYVLRRNGAKYEVAKYTYGNGTPTIIYGDLTYNAGSNIFPWGITVNDGGEVFVTNPVSQWEIIKLTPQPDGSYVSRVVQSGGWFSALTRGHNNGLIAIDLLLSDNNHRFQLYPAGNEDQTGSRLAFPTMVPPGATTYPWGAAIDAANNYYALDLHENNGGQIIRMNATGGPGAYTTHDLIGAGKYYTALAIDDQNNFYTTERNGATYRVVKRTDITQPTGELLLDGLSTNGAALPWGLAVDKWGQVYVGDGSSPTGGRLMKLSPPTSVLSVEGNGNLRTNASDITYTFTLSAPAANVASSAFHFAQSGAISGAGITGVTQTSATTYTVSINTGTGSGTLQLVPNGGAMIPMPGNLPYNDGDIFVIDKAPPAVALVGSPADGYYNAGQALEFQVTYTEPVVVTGTPSLPVIIGSTTVQANYTSGTGTNSHIFTYTVQAGDMDMDGITLGAGIVTGGATIRDEAGNNLIPGLNNVTPTAGVRVNTASPTVTLSTTAASPVNQAFPVTATFSEAVTGFTLGGLTATNATLSNLITADNIHYTLTVTPLSDGAVTVQLPAGAARNIGNNPNTASNTLSLTYNTIAPAITSVAVPADGTYKSGDMLNFTVNFDKSVVVSNGIPTLSLTIGATTVQAGYTGSAGAGALTFAYTVQSGQQDADGISIGTLALNGAAIRDAATNNANLTLAGVGNTSGVLVDAVAPVINSVSVPPDRIHRTNDVLVFIARFSENVIVTGSPFLSVTIGNTVRQFPYIGSPISSDLTFGYTVKNGDLDMDGITPASQLELNGGTIRDMAGNNAVLALNNTGNTSGVFVNTQRPTVTLTTPATGRVHMPVTVTFTFSEAVTGLAAANIRVTNGAAGNLQTADNITYTAVITPAADGAVSVSLPADAAANIAGNGNDASNSVSFTYDATAPVINPGQSFTINQYSPAGTEIGQVSAAADADPLQNWAIANGSAFEITGTGMLRVKDAALLAPLGGTTVTLQVTVSDGLNTSAPTPVTIQVTLVNQAPTLDPIANVSHCADTETHTVQLTGASATEPAQAYTITAAAGADIFDQLTINAANVLSYRLKAGATPGTTTITVTVRDNGGTANGGTDSLRRAFTLTLTSPPAISITSDKGTTVSKGETVRLTASGGTAYQWANADGIVSGQQSAVLEVRAQVNATYEVTATNAAGCAATGTISIAVLNDFKVDATNILTPNGDGRNDRWVIRNLDSYPDNEVKIFDRAGRLVYQRRNYSNTWDGTVNGSPLAEGTYYYILTISGGAATAKGYITIVRDGK